MKNKLRNILEQFQNITILEDVPMSSYTTYKIGGNADFLVYPDTIEQLKNLLYKLKEKKYPFFILGAGSNILVSDNGIRGVVISLEKCSSNINLNSKGKFEVGAGTYLEEVVKFAQEHSISGFENFSGIPGTVGGALIMNAGAFGREIGDNTEWIEVINLQNDIETINPKNVKFGYRLAPGLKDKIIISAMFFGYIGNDNINSLQKKREDILLKRSSKQPLEYGSCGSVFKRPQNNYAGVLIEKSGCKGMKIGGAMISKKHANFIVNLGNASAMDVFNLIKKVQNKVYNTFNISLEPEVKFIGEFPSLKEINPEDM